MCGACGRSEVSDPVLGTTRTLRQHLIVAQTINAACQSWPGAPKVAATSGGWLVSGPTGATEAVSTVEALWTTVLRRRPGVTWRDLSAAADLETGDLGTEDREAPDLETGDLGTEDREAPDLGTEDREAPDLGTEDREAPDLETGDLGTEDREAPDLGTEDREAPDLETGDLGTEDREAPDLGTADLEAGELGTADLALRVLSLGHEMAQDSAIETGA